MESNCIIGLGSNLGQRISLLLEAMEAIEHQVGAIRQLSQPYETEAWGFDAPPFINACIRVETPLTSAEVLVALQTIESAFGRQRSSDEGYQSRTLDLDLLFFGAEILQTETLQLPHPRILQRRFVLDPLAELIPDFEHPTRKQSIAALQNQCTDDTAITSLPFRAWMAPLFPADSYIALAGNIGSGKTSMTKRLAHDFGTLALYEQFAENPHLPQFYKDPSAYALATERHFLSSRVQQLAAHANGALVSDFWLNKSLIFAENSLQTKDFALFSEMFKQQSQKVRLPDKVIYLHRPLEELKLHIQKRGRSYEQSISTSYLDTIQKGYKTALDKTYPYPVHSIDASGKDYTHRPLLYIQWVNRLARL